MQGSPVRETYTEFEQRLPNIVISLNARNELAGKSVFIVTNG
jgi:hypothetical protein